MTFAPFSDDVEANQSGSRSTRSGGLRRALCIGINAYSRRPLKACVNDATNWANWFRRQDFEVAVLTNHQATKSRILSIIMQLVEHAHRGDVVAIQYSGHGTSVSDRLIADESDRLDEAIVPVDMNLIIDDELGAICRRLRVGVNLTFIFDCCHSGTATRNILGGIERSSDELVRFLPADEVMRDSFMRARARSAQRSPRDPYQGHPEILFSACMSGQKAKESGGQGVFSRHALSILRNGIGSLTNADFLRRVLQSMGSRAQTPQLWADTSRYHQPLLAAPSTRDFDFGGETNFDVGQEWNDDWKLGGEFSDLTGYSRDQLLGEICKKLEALVHYSPTRL